MNPKIHTKKKTEKPISKMKSDHGIWIILTVLKTKKVLNCYLPWFKKSGSFVLSFLTVKAFVELSLLKSPMGTERLEKTSSLNERSILNIYNLKKRHGFKSNFSRLISLKILLKKR